MTTKAEQASINKYDLLFESRLTRAETINEHLVKDISEIKTSLNSMRSEMKSDFRWMLTIIGSGLISLLGLMAHGFKWII